MLPSKGVGLRILNEVVADFWELHDVHGRDCITKSIANYRISTGTSLCTVFSHP